MLRNDDLWKHSTAIALTIMALSFAVFVGCLQWCYNYDDNPTVIAIHNFFETDEPKMKEPNRYVQKEDQK
jgi:hypothetical protein